MKKNLTPLIVVAALLVATVILLSWLFSVGKKSFASTKKIISEEIDRPAAPPAPPAAPRAALYFPIPYSVSQPRTIQPSVFRIVPDTASRRAVSPPTRRLMRHESPVDDSAWIQFRAMDGELDVTSKCRWESSNPGVRYLGGASKLDFGAGYIIQWPMGVFAGDEAGSAIVTASYQGKTATAKLDVLP